MTDRVTSILVRGKHPSGSPAEVKIELTLPWEEVRETVRSGNLPIAVADELIVRLITMGNAE